MAHIRLAWTGEPTLLPANESRLRCFERLPGFPHGSPRVEAAPRGFELGVAATFLLHEVELDPSDRFDGGENLLPRRDAFAEEDAIGLLRGLGARRPVLEVNALDAAGIRLDPRDRVSTAFQARAHIELKNEFARRIGGDDVHDARSTGERSPLDAMVVKTGEQTVRFELLDGRRELATHPLPGFESLGVRRR